MRTYYVQIRFSKKILHRRETVIITMMNSTRETNPNQNSRENNVN